MEGKVAGPCSPRVRFDFPPPRIGSLGVLARPRDELRPPEPALLARAGDRVEHDDPRDVARKVAGVDARVDARDPELLLEQLLNDASDRVGVEPTDLLDGDAL